MTGRDKPSESSIANAAADAAQTRAPRCPLPKWGRRLGAAAFLFFLIKGLAWLAVPALIAMGLMGR